MCSTMEGVQNLRKAVYDFKLRSESAEGAKAIKIYSVAINYLYRSIHSFSIILITLTFSERIATEL